MAGQIKLISLNVNVFHYEFKSCPVKINTINSAASVADLPSATLAAEFIVFIFTDIKINIQKYITREVKIYSLDSLQF
jgi:hypothetical protein